MQLEIESNTAEAAKAIASKKTATWRAMRRSMERTLQGARAFSARAIRQRNIVRLSTADLKKGIIGQVVLDSLGRSDRIVGRLTFSPASVSMARFFARTVRVGRRVGVQVRALDGHTYRVGFPLQHLKQLNGKRRLTRVTKIGDKSLIFVREGRERLPIRKVYGASVSDVVKYSSLREKILAEAHASLSREMARNLRFFMARKAQ